KMAMAELEDPRREINPARAIRTVFVGFMGALHGVAPSSGRGQRSRVQFVAIVTFAPVGSAKVTHITPERAFPPFLSLTVLLEASPGMKPSPSPKSSAAATSTSRGAAEHERMGGPRVGMRLPVAMAEGALRGHIFGKSGEGQRSRDDGAD